MYLKNIILIFKKKQMPSLEKELLVRTFENINKNFTDFENFIETGTYYGDTSLMVSKFFNKVYTIEINQDLYKRSKISLSKSENVEVIEGDSLDVFKILLPTLKNNCVFWLDGHNSGPGTGVGKIDFPVVNECELIDELLICDEILIIIDDVRLFGMNHQYSIDDSLQNLTIDNILNVFKLKKIKKYWTDKSSLSDNDRLLIHLTAIL